MRLVVDASVALKWFLGAPQEADVQTAHTVLLAARDGQIQLTAPPHWHAEILAVLARKEPERLADSLIILYDLDLSEVSGRNVHVLAAQLSVQLDHHLFDTLYHAVALEADAQLLTADEKYFAKSRHLGHILRLQSFQASSF